MIQLLDTNTVKHPISNHPKYKDLVIAYGRCSIIGVDKQDVSSKTSSRHTYLVEDNLLPAISKLPICISVAVPKINVNKSSSIRDHIMYQVVAYKKLKTMENNTTVRLKNGCSRSRMVAKARGF